jgi:hypothetical protein
MAYTTIDDPSAYFQATTYTGAGANTVVTNGGNSDLQPDLLWIKNRTAGYGHFLVDSSRNISYAQNSSNAPYLETESTAAENSNQNWMQSVNTDGFTTGISEHINSNSGSSFVAWQWKVNGGTTTSLSSNINSVCQVNQDAGISIVTYSCTGGGNGQAVQHGLGLVPQVIITKNRTDTSYSDWITYHHSIGYTNFLKLNTTAAQAGSSPYNGAAPTNLTYNVSIDLVETKDYVSYVFAPIQGYSKFGSYKGNGDSSKNGPFVYLGFKPAFVMIKPATQVEEWAIIDTARNPINQAMKQLKANSSGAEYNGASVTNGIDILSNGFKVRTSRTEINTINATYIYMAFAENPFVTSTGTPTTAR